jgi:predicted nucleic acid-binding protein
MDYLLDTNIVLNLIRESPLSKQLRADFQLFNHLNACLFRSLWKVN